MYLAADQEDYETPALDELPDNDDPDEDDEITRLIRYLEETSYHSYARADFDKRLDEAKFALQMANYRKTPRRSGFLQDEIDRLVVHINTIPQVFAILALLTSFGLSFLIPSNAGQYLVAVLFAVFSCYWVGAWSGGLIWWSQYTRKNLANTRAKALRLRNHDVLVNKIKRVQSVSLEKAQNKDPEKGATGLLRLYLTFICGYVLHKTLNRCFTRFHEDLYEVAIPTVAAKTNLLGAVALVALLACWCNFALSQSGAADFSKLIWGFPTVPSTFLFASFAACWFVYWRLRRRVLSQGGRVTRQVQFLEELYKVRVPVHLLTRFGERPSQRKRFDFPSTYEYNDVEQYSKWLFETLTALKKHEDEVRS